MAIENHGPTRLSARKLYVTTGAEDDISFSGNAVLARLRHCDTQLPDSLAQSVRAHLDRILHSDHFDGSTRSREFLRYVVEEVLAGRAAYLKQAAIAVEVFGRKPDFDAVIDPIVRVQAGRLRRSLERYYLLSGDATRFASNLPRAVMRRRSWTPSNRVRRPSPCPNRRATGRPSRYFHLRPLGARRGGRDRRWSMS